MSPWVKEGPLQEHYKYITSLNSLSHVPQDIYKTMIKKVLSSLINKNGAAQNNIPQSDVILTLLVLTSSLVYVSHAQQVYNIWEPPWAEFDNSVVVRTYYGDVRGFSVPWHVEDEAWNPDWDDQPRWFVQRVNCWLGVPYAEAPVGRLRFQVGKLGRKL